MKYRYDVIISEETGRKNMLYHLNDKVNLPDTEIEELVEEFLKREDIRTLVITSSNNKRLHGLKGYIKYLLHKKYKVAENESIYKHFYVGVNEALYVRRKRG